MSDENTGAPAPEAPKSSSEQMIPKSRFDELVAQKKEAQNNAAMMQQMVQQMAAANKPRQQQKEDPVLKRLREENPDVYAMYTRQQRELETVRGSAAQLAEHQDRQEFFGVAGRSADRYAEKVEAVIQAERQNGNYNVKRSAVYAFIRGQEAIQKDANPVSNDEYVPTTQAAVEAVDDAVGAPASNPSSVAPRGASTAALSGEKSREERLRELDNIIF